MAIATMRLGPADHGRAMTLDEYLVAEVEEGYRYELARGVLEVTDVPKDAHGVIVFTFYVALAEYHLAHPGVIHRYGGGSEFQFIVPGLASERNPDIAVASLATEPGPRNRRAASFAVEVVSEGKEARERDYVSRREEYLAYGLAEYWIVDPAERRVTILTRDGDAWAERVVAGDGAAESTVLTGFVVPLASLWPAEESAEEG